MQTTTPRQQRRPDNTDAREVLAIRPSGRLSNRRPRHFDGHHRGDPEGNEHDSEHAGEF